MVVGDTLGATSVWWWVKPSRRHNTIMHPYDIPMNNSRKQEAELLQLHICCDTCGDSFSWRRSRDDFGLVDNVLASLVHGDALVACLVPVDFLWRRPRGEFVFSAPEITIRQEEEHGLERR